MRGSLGTLLLAACLAGAAPAPAQTFFNESFGAASGTTPPPGWTKTLASGANPSVDGWRFDNPNGITLSPPITAPAAVCDSDFSGPSNNIVAHLDSPAFNAGSVTGALTLEWDQWHRPLGSTVEVFVFDGSSLNSVFFDSNGTPNPDGQSLNITAAAGGASNAFVRFTYTGNFDWWWLVDNVTVFGPPQSDDVGVSSIDGPVSGSLGVETISVSVTNFGGNPQSGFDVVYSVNSGPAVTETFAATLASGATATFNFATTFDFSTPAAYTIDATTALVGDLDPSNDAAQAMLTSYGIVSTFPYFESFEAGNGGFTSSGANDDWEHGAPADSFITGAAGGAFAWVTDINGNHNNNEDAVLESLVFDFTGVTTTPILSFDHIFQIEGFYDGHWVEISTNGGPWVTLGGVGTGTNWYNTAGNSNNGGIAWDGNSGSPGAWRTAVHPLSGAAGNTVQLRWRFESDISVTNDGAGIDNVTVTVPAPSLGQAPQPGIAELDVNNAVNGSLAPVSSGANGPYFAKATAAGSADFTMSGEVGANQPVILLAGPLNVPGTPFPPYGSLDLGGPGFAGVVVVANGAVPGTLLDSLFNLGPAGTIVLSFGTPASLVGQVVSFQCVMFHTTNQIGFSNAVELTVCP